jgi:hypothetical protein
MFHPLVADLGSMQEKPMTATAIICWMPGRLAVAAEQFTRSAATVPVKPAKPRAIVSPIAEKPASRDVLMQAMPTEEHAVLGQENQLYAVALVAKPATALPQKNAICSVCPMVLTKHAVARVAMAYPRCKCELLHSKPLIKNIVLLFFIKPRRKVGF